MTLPISPNWSEFNQILDGDGFQATSIGYGSIFPESPTKSDVVEKSLDYVMDVAQKLGNEFAVFPVTKQYMKLL